MNGILKESTVVKEFDFIKPDVHEIDSLLDDIFKDCRNKYFREFEYRLVSDIKFINISTNEEVNFTITQRSMQLKTEFHGLKEKIKNAQRNGFIFNQVFKVTMKTVKSIRYKYTLLSKISYTNNAPTVFQITISKSRICKNSL